MHKTILIGLIFSASAASADVTMNFSDGSFVHLTESRAAMGSKTDGYAIFETGKDKFIMVDPSEETYMEVDENFGSDVRSAVSAQMEAMLAQLPPEQREMVKQQMGNMPGGMPGMPGMAEPPKMTVEKTGKKDKVAGFKCSEARVSYGGMFEEMACIATIDELGLERSDFDVLSAAMKSMSKISGRENKKDAVTDLDVMGGVPIRTVDLRHDRSHELVSLSRKDIDARVFAVPQGYRKVSVEDMMRQ